MSAPINLPTNSPTNIDTPSTGRYNLFLNSSDSDQLYKKDSSGVSTAVVIAGSGTVTSVSVVSANGLAGTVANATTTPAITLSTSINSPVLAGNGTALIAATTTGSGSTVVLSTSPTFVTDISAPKIISSTVSGGLLLCNNNGVTVASFGVGSAGSTNIALIGATAVTGTISGTSSLTLGTASTTVGSIVLNNATNANTITIQSGVTTSSHTLTLPVANASGVLTNNGSGTLTWAAASSGITIDSTSITGGGANRILFENSANQVSESATNFYFQTATPFNHVFAAGRTGVITGVDNTAIGYQAGKVLTTGTNNLFIGYNAGVTILSGSSNVFLGSEAGGLLTANNISNNVFIGYTAGQQSSGGNNVSIGESTGMGVRNNNTSVGARAGFARTSNQDDNALFGYYAGGYQNGNYCTFLGSYAGFASGFGGAAVNYSIALGYSARVNASNQMVIGYTDATSCISNIWINGTSSTTPQDSTLHLVHASGTNVAGANFIISGSAATGTGAGGYVKTTTSVKGSSGTTVQSDTDRNTIVAKYVDITGGAATTFGQLALATSSTNAGGEVLYTIHASDGTDTQSLTGVLKYDIVNKAGTLTVTYSDVQNGAGACSAGTLTATVTATTSGTNVLFQANAVSSLSETVLRVSFQVINNFGVATITSA